MRRALVVLALLGCRPEAVHEDLFVDRSELLADYIQWTIPADPGDARCDVAEHMAGGAAVGDVDGDGAHDIVLARDGHPDTLLLGDGEVFADATATWLDTEADASISVQLADLDGDGALDLLVGGWNGSARVFLQRDDRFELAATHALGRGADCTGVFGFAVADIDADGDLDVHVSVYEAGETSSSQLWENDGAGGFTDVTAAWGVDLSGVWAFTSAFADLDGDRDPDLLVAGDFRTSRYFVHEGDHYVERTLGLGFGTDENGMGLAVGDVDGDGVLDAFVSAIYDEREPCAPQWGCSGNRLYLGVGDGTFTDATDAFGVRDGGWGWGVGMLDHDLDGDVDLALTNGYPKPWPGVDPDQDVSPFERDPMRLWSQIRGGAVDLAPEVGLDDRGPGRALVPFDWGRDGDVDLLVVHSGAPPVLYENRGTSAAWLAVEGAPGTEVEVEVEGVVQRQTVGHRTGFASGGPAEWVFGLGQTEEVGLRWRAPGGAWTDEGLVDARQRLVLP